MINLEKELTERSKQIKEKESEIFAVESVQKLLALDGAADFHMLKELGLHHDLQAAIETKGAMMEKYKFEEKYGKVFHIDEIEKIALKYGLKMLPTSYFKAPIDLTLLQKIKEFQKENEMSEQELGLDRKFFFLAPPKMFRLAGAKKEGLSFRERMAKAIEEQTDPILFFKIDESHYRMIHKFGKDLTIWRRLIGWKYFSEINYFIYWFIIAFLTLDVPLNILNFPRMGIFCGLVAGIWTAASRTFSKEYPFYTWKDIIDSKPYWRSEYKMKN